MLAVVMISLLWSIFLGGLALRCPIFPLPLTVETQLAFGATVAVFVALLTTPPVLLLFRYRYWWPKVFWVFGSALVVALITSSTQNLSWFLDCSMATIYANVVGVALILPRCRPDSSVQHCAVCQYNLTGNVSGICPECGTVIYPAQPNSKISTWATNGSPTKLRRWGGRMLLISVPVLSCIGSVGLVIDPALKFWYLRSPVRMRTDLDGDNPEQRLAAVQELIRRGDPNLPEVLVLKLGDSDQQVRLWSVIGLTRMGSESPREPVLLLAKDPEAIVRQAVMRFAGLQRDPQGIAVLMHGLNDGSDIVVRAAMESSGMLQIEEAIPTLLSLLDDNRRYVGDDALIALARIKGVRCEGPWPTALAEAKQWWEQLGKQALKPLN